MVFEKGNIGGKFKMSYKIKINPKKKIIMSKINKYLIKNFISKCSFFCKSCKIYDRCPYICDYCNGHKVCKEMCAVSKLTKENLNYHNKKKVTFLNDQKRKFFEDLKCSNDTLDNNLKKVNISNNDLFDIIPDLDDFIKST